MRINQFFKFFDAVSTSTESNVLINQSSSQLVLQVEGAATAFSISVVGIVDSETEEYETLAVINNSDFSVSNEITNKGIYTIGTDGIVKIKLILNSISGGDITAFGRLGE